MCVFTTDPTAVTNLKAVATSFQSIMVTWNLPQNPNGPIDRYIVYHLETDIVQTPPQPINSRGYKRTIVNAPIRQSEIIGLNPYTNYSIHVQAIGVNDSMGDIDVEIQQRTNTTTPPPPTVPPTNETTDRPTTNTIFIHLPNPDQIETGPVM